MTRVTDKSTCTKYKKVIDEESICCNVSGVWHHFLRSRLTKQLFTKYTTNNIRSRCVANVERLLSIVVVHSVTVAIISFIKNVQH